MLVLPVEVRPVGTVAPTTTAAAAEPEPAAAAAGAAEPGDEAGAVARKAPAFWKAAWAPPAALAAARYCSGAVRGMSPFVSVEVAG